ncbi:MAG: hypothetical protein WA125_04165, partial [Desulfosporosinus sp.]
ECRSEYSYSSQRLSLLILPLRKRKFYSSASYLIPGVLQHEEEICLNSNYHFEKQLEHLIGKMLIFYLLFGHLPFIIKTSKKSEGSGAAKHPPIDQKWC